MEKLPKKWFCKTLDEEQDKVLKKWRGGGYSGPRNRSVMTSDKCWSYIEQVIDSHTEITFYDFERLVLKINKERSYELW